MATQDDFRWAAAAWRETLRRCTLSLAAGLERKARTFMAVPATKLDGQETMELAKALREEARKAGLS
jgi:hypothetical protein